jgi:dihydroorotase
MNGAVDVHVHLREPGFTHKETIKSGTMAAAKGGVTTCLAMPNLNPCPDSLDNLKVELDIIEKDALVNVLPFGSVTKGEKGDELASLEEIKDKVVAFTDDGVGVNNIDLLVKAMEFAKANDMVIASHAEDLVNGKLPEGEYKAVRREIELAKKIGCKYHFCHMSTKESLEAIRNAHKEGFTNITCEVAPHHLILNEEMIKDGNWKMNPPLRSEENRLETIKALLDGTACMVASDHAPHSEIEKSQEYSKCPNGIIGIETMLPIVYTYFIDKGLATHQDFINWFITNPSKVFNLKEKKIEINEEADLVALDINTNRKYTKEEILSKSTNAPYIGMEFKGFPILTILKDKIVWRMNYEK